MYTDHKRPERFQ